MFLWIKKSLSECFWDCHSHFACSSISHIVSPRYSFRSLIVATLYWNWFTVATVTFWLIKLDFLKHESFHLWLNITASTWFGLLLNLYMWTSLLYLRLWLLWDLWCWCLRLWATITESTCEVLNAHHFISFVRSCCTTDYMESSFHNVGTVTAAWSAIIDE
jgi:hypothetical protein